ETYQKLCRLGMLRFSSNAQGLTALALADGLLSGPTDAVTLSMAREIVKRLSGAQDWSRELATYVESILALREQHHAEALVLLDKFLGESGGGLARINADSTPGSQAKRRFIRAMLCAELGRTDE